MKSYKLQSIDDSTLKYLELNYTQLKIVYSVQTKDKRNTGFNI